ncbi:hypothetical protein [Endothiovibrio diazotrophicus]
MSKVPVYYKVTALYALFGVLWIFFSDRLLDILVSDRQLLGVLQTFKGWFYVAITSLLLFLLIRIDYLALERKEREKAELFTATISAVHHILNNFLNKMVLFRVRAEEKHDIDPEIVTFYDRVIDEARDEIDRLSSVEELTEEKIHAVIRR